MIVENGKSVNITGEQCDVLDTGEGKEHIYISNSRFGKLVLRNAACVVILQVNNCGLQSFSEIPPLAGLRILDVSNNMIGHFSLMNTYPGLRKISVTNNPVMHRYPQADIMRFLCFLCPQLRILNGTYVTDETGCHQQYASTTLAIRYLTEGMERSNTTESVYQGSRLCALPGYKNYVFIGENEVRDTFEYIPFAKDAYIILLVVNTIYNTYIIQACRTNHDSDQLYIVSSSETPQLDEVLRLEFFYNRDNIYKIQVARRRRGVETRDNITSMLGYDAIKNVLSLNYKVTLQDLYLDSFEIALLNLRQERMLLFSYKSMLTSFDIERFGFTLYCTYDREYVYVSVLYSKHYLNYVNAASGTYTIVYMDFVYSMDGHVYSYLGDHAKWPITGKDYLDVRVSISFQLHDTVAETTKTMHNVWASHEKIALSTRQMDGHGTALWAYDISDRLCVGDKVALGSDDVKYYLLGEEYLIRLVHRFRDKTYQELAYNFLFNIRGPDLVAVHKHIRGLAIQFTTMCPYGEVGVENSAITLNSEHYHGMITACQVGNGGSYIVNISPNLVEYSLEAFKISSAKCQLIDLPDEEMFMLNFETNQPMGCFHVHITDHKGRSVELNDTYYVSYADVCSSLLGEHYGTVDAAQGLAEYYRRCSAVIECNNFANGVTATAELYLQYSANNIQRRYDDCDFFYSREIVGYMNQDGRHTAFDDFQLRSTNFTRIYASYGAEDDFIIQVRGELCVGMSIYLEFAKSFLLAADYSSMYGYVMAEGGSDINCGQLAGLLAGDVVDGGAYILAQNKTRLTLDETLAYRYLYFYAQQRGILYVYRFNNTVHFVQDGAVYALELEIRGGGRELIAHVLTYSWCHGTRFYSLGYWAGSAVGSGWAPLATDANGFVRLHPGAPIRVVVRYPDARSNRVYYLEAIYLQEPAYSIAAASTAADVPESLVELPCYLLRNTGRWHRDVAWRGTVGAFGGDLVQGLGALLTLEAVDGADTHVFLVAGGEVPDAAYGPYECYVLYGGVISCLQVDRAYDTLYLGYLGGQSEQWRLCHVQAYAELDTAVLILQLPRDRSARLEFLDGGERLAAIYWAINRTSATMTLPHPAGGLKYLFTYQHSGPQLRYFVDERLADIGPLPKVYVYKCQRFTTVGTMELANGAELGAYDAGLEVYCTVTTRDYEVYLNLFRHADLAVETMCLEYGIPVNGLELYGGCTLSVEMSDTGSQVVLNDGSADDEDAVVLVAGDDVLVYDGGGLVLYLTNMGNGEVHTLTFATDEHKMAAFVSIGYLSPYRRFKASEPH